MQIDISMQDTKHYGLKCVDLVLSFTKEYEALEPLIFSLKNILKNANLNDPYTVNINNYILIFNNILGWFKFIWTHFNGCQLLTSKLLN